MQYSSSCLFISFLLLYLQEYYRFVGYLPIPERLSAPNYTADLRQGVAVEYVSCEPSITARELFDEDTEPEE